MRKQIILSSIISLIPYFPLLATNSITVEPIDTERLEFSYEIFVPEGINQTGKKYFYVDVSVGEEMMANIPRITAIASFIERNGKQAGLKIAEIDKKLCVIEKKNTNRVSKYYAFAEEAIRTSITNYYQWKSPQSHAKTRSKILISK